MRLPLRVKFSLVMVLILVSSIGILTYLSMQFYIHDKETYIYEINTLAAKDRSGALTATLAHLREKMRIFSSTYAASFQSPEKKAELLESFFSQYQEFLAFYLFFENGNSANLFSSKKLSAVGIAPAELEKLLQRKGFAVPAVLSQGTFLANATVNVKLPAFALGFPLPGGSPKGRVVALGIIDLGQLDPGSSERGLQETFVVNARGEVIYHTNPAWVVEQADFSKYEIVQSMFANSRGVLAANRAVHSPDGESMLAAYSLIEDGHAGVVVQVPRAFAFRGARNMISQAFTVAGVIFVLSVFFALVVANSVTNPVKELAKATRRIARGDFKARIKTNSQDEIGDLARSFNRMGIELTEREAALEEANNKLIQSEKMAAFGQLGAGIAHEVKNPLAGILGYAQLAMKKLAEDDPVKKNLAIIEKETKRCKEIIENLLRFARQEKAEFTPYNLSQILSDAVQLVEHQLTLNHVKIVRNITTEPVTILGNANQLQQVLMNLMINAQHAMEAKGGGELRVYAGKENGFGILKVRDTGHGIPEAIRQKIFEPFFTTKPAGKGTGLGLSVTYGIIKDHKGEVVIESQEGVGTEFIIKIPLHGDGAGVTLPVTPAPNNQEPVEQVHV